jgi:UDPglucose--hexose-1-phosphate uridylyltransferase
MKEKIRFENHIQRSTFHNPLLGNRLDTQQMEIRKDPLTGRQSVFNPSLEDKATLFFGASDHALLDRLARESEPKCFLCGDRWKKLTPKYPEELVPGGRVQVGESVLFPNLFPISQVHAVLRVGSNHYVPLRDFSSSLIEEAFLASITFIKLLSRAQEAVRFLTINANYLGPAGASILHPHFQVLGSDIPYTHTEELLALGRAYHGQHGSCYWADLAEKERELGVRCVARTGAVTWVTAFSPRGTNEVLGILTEKRDFLEMADRDWTELAEGFSAVLGGYASQGISTFNFTLYSGPLGAHDDSFRCFLRVISRQNVYENYRTDDYFLQKLLRNEVILNPPEKLASILRGFFGGRRKEG